MSNQIERTKITDLQDETIREYLNDVFLNMCEMEDLCDGDKAVGDIIFREWNNLLSGKSDIRMICLDDTPEEIADQVFHMSIPTSVRTYFTINICDDTYVIYVFNKTPEEFMKSCNQAMEEFILNHGREVIKYARRELAAYSAIIDVIERRRKAMKVNVHLTVEELEKLQRALKDSESPSKYYLLVKTRSGLIWEEEQK